MPESTPESTTVTRREGDLGNRNIISRGWDR